MKSINQFILLGLLLFCSSSWVNAQNSRSIQGTVIEKSTNEAIPGASVQIQGTTVGTVTDLNGQFTLDVTTEDPVLVVSFIGFATQEIPVGNSNNYTVYLESELSNLQEVVVVGYGTQKRERITTAVETVGSEEFVKGAVN